MTATLTTLNISREQIEAELRAGKSVDDITTEWQEPRSNVLGVLRAMQGSVEPPASTPARPAAPTPPVTPPRPSPVDPVDPAAITVDALVNAAARSESKRTQALGVKLADLAQTVRTRLADEREHAEAVEAQRRQREAAVAEVTRLEAQLAAARAKVSDHRGGVGSVRHDRTSVSVPASGALICGQGCGKMFSRPAWLAKHEATCGGPS